jgi:endonuclease/exonuclease/phosphatase family metal-dependent hydrolase
VHGAEPAATVPTPLSRYRDDEEKVIDYIFVNELVAVHDAWITFDRAHDTDERLSASDHFGLAATISLAR